MTSDERDDPRTYDADGGAIDRVLDDRPVVVVSNREPYVHESGDDGITVSRPAGGLTAALDPLMQSVGGTWVAWGSGDADADVVDDEDRVRVPPDDPAYDLRRVWLDDELVDGYYYGYSNQVLWPVCHGMPSKVRYEDEFWRTYHEANERFADVVAEEADDGGLVWFQDYHFGLAPRMVRRRHADAFLLHFWHVPWPPWDVLRRVPQSRAVLRGLLANDAIAFHTDRDRRYFVGCASAALDAEYDPTRGRLLHGDGTTHVRTHPLGVDADAIAETARSPASSELWEALVDEHGLDSSAVAIGVDRLDYTKGIVERLDALGHLWETDPDWRGELTLVQKSSESRSRIDEYRRVQRAVTRRVERLNDRFGTDDWQPVIYLDGFVPWPELVGLYREADVALVSSLRDGMNLVAKEFVAAQVDDPGVLVLSELAGAVEELGDGALTINPIDTPAFAGTIRRALEMPPAERRRRLDALRSRVHAADGESWIEDQLRTVDAVSRQGVTRGRTTTVSNR